MIEFVIIIFLLALFIWYVYNLFSKKENKKIRTEQDKERQRLKDQAQRDLENFYELEKNNKKMCELEIARQKQELEKNKELYQQKLDFQLKEEEKTKREWLEKDLEEFSKEINLEKEKANQELLAVKSKLKEKEKIQEAYGQEVARRREIEEKEDYFKVGFTKEELEDIETLRGISGKLNNKDNLNKMLYDTYCSKNVAAMTKRILNGKAPSGIYKITRLKTGEIYIGKSTNVKDRWIQHCKTVFHVGTIAHSILHTTMEKDGIENFTFELLEEVPKDKLTEREKFWIDFYKSKEYGLNERKG